MLEAAGLDPGHQRYLGIAVRPWPGFEEKAPIFAEAADYAYEAHGLIPVFLPIEARLDIGAAQQVAAHIQKAPYVILPESTSSSRTHRPILPHGCGVVHAPARADFCRRHGVPLVGAVYDPKVSSFLDAVGQDLYTPFYRLDAATLKEQLDIAVARGQDRPRLEDGARRLLLLEQQNSAQAGSY